MNKMLLLVLVLAVTGSVFGWSLETTNGVSDEKGLPGELSDADLAWSLKLGTHQYSVPAFKDGRIYLGINDQMLKHPVLKKTGGGIVMCIDQASQDLVWQLVIPRYMDGVKAPYHFNQWRCGICSFPAMDEKFMYIVGSRGDVLCIDRKGLSDGNDGPFTDEGEYMGYHDGSNTTLAKTDGDIVWQYDMIKGVKTVPHDVCGSSPVLLGDYLYVCTTNGQDDKHDLVANPLAPTLIVLDKRTGKLVATDGELIGKRMYHGHWSSPVIAEIDGRKMILFGGGDGVLYAFNPVKASNNSMPVKLEKIWEHDCNPAKLRELPYANWRNKEPVGPSEVIATPVICNDLIYIAIGQSPIHGPGDGAISCIDAATGKQVWQSQLVDRSLCTVSVSDGLLYVADFSGNLHCFDADTGKRYWVHDLEKGVWAGSTYVADGKVYVGTEGNIFWILQHGKEKKVLSRQRLDSAPATVVADGGMLYVPTQRYLHAYKVAGE